MQITDTVFNVSACQVIKVIYDGIVTYPMLKKATVWNKNKQGQLAPDEDTLRTQT